MNPMEEDKMPRYLISNKKANDEGQNYFKMLFQLLENNNPDYEEEEM